METIAIGSDHGGINLKNKIIEYLDANKIQYKDFGTFNTQSCDYPIIARTVANSVANKEYTKGILVCGSGVGMSIVANKVKGIRAVVCSDTYTAKKSREHNNANILCLGERVIGFDLAYDIVDIWLNTNFEIGGRHQRRVDMIEE